jgi:hypothetical protein
MDYFSHGPSFLSLSVLGAESSHQPHDSMTFPEKTNFPDFWHTSPF